MERTQELETRRTSVVVGVNSRHCYGAIKSSDTIPDDAGICTRKEHLQGLGPNVDIFLLIGHPEPFNDGVIKQVQMFAAIYNNVRMVST